jgi:hypothetical protein
MADLYVGGKDGPRTIVPRLNEACGGHTSVGLKINWSGGPVRVTTPSTRRARGLGDDIDLACVP